MLPMVRLYSLRVKKMIDKDATPETWHPALSSAQRARSLTLQRYLALLLCLFLQAHPTVAQSFRAKIQPTADEGKVHGEQEIIGTETGIYLHFCCSVYLLDSGLITAECNV
jgi:hypothetical protein